MPDAWLLHCPCGRVTVHRVLLGRDGEVLRADMAEDAYKEGCAARGGGGGGSVIGGCDGTTVGGGDADALMVAMVGVGQLQLFVQMF